MFPSTALVVQSLWSLHWKICKYLLQQARSADGNACKYNWNSLPLANMQVIMIVLDSIHIFDVPYLDMWTHVHYLSQRYRWILLGRFPKIYASNLPRTDSSWYQDLGFQVRTSSFSLSCVIFHDSNFTGCAHIWYIFWSVQGEWYH